MSESCVCCKQAQDESNGLTRLRMNNRETQKLLECVEITIAVQQGMVMAQAMRRDQHVDRVPDRPPGGAKLAIVACRVDRGPRVRHRNQLEFIEDRFDDARGPLVSHALQHLGNGDRRETKPLSIEP